MLIIIKTLLFQFMKFSLNKSRSSKSFDFYEMNQTVINESDYSFKMGMTYFHSKLSIFIYKMTSILFGSPFKRIDNTILWTKSLNIKNAQI